MAIINLAVYEISREQVTLKNLHQQLNLYFK